MTPEQVGLLYIIVAELGFIIGFLMYYVFRKL